MSSQRSLNKVMLIGPLVRDPERRELAGGNVVCNFNVETIDRWRGKGDKVEKRSETHAITAFAHVAEIVCQYRRGDRLYIEGALRRRRWLDAGGHNRETVEIVAAHVIPLPAREGANKAP